MGSHIDLTLCGELKVETTSLKEMHFNTPDTLKGHITIVTTERKTSEAQLPLEIYS